MCIRLRAPMIPFVMNGCMLLPVPWHRQLEIGLARANTTGLSTKQVFHVLICHGVYWLQVCWFIFLQLGASRPNKPMGCLQRWRVADVC